MLTKSDSSFHGKLAGLGAAVLISVFLAPAALDAAGLDYHVSPKGNDRNAGTRAKPFATIERARDAVRALKQSGSLTRPVTVWLHAGNFFLSQPVVFTPEDSGTATCPVTYAAAPGEQPVVHGGRGITGWRKHQGNVWVVDLPEVQRGEWFFRQLYVNGQQRRRARVPNEGFLRVASFPDGTPKTVNYHKDCQRFGFKPGDIRPDWTNLSEVEVIVYHFWTDSHLPIQSVDTQSNIVTFAHKAGKVFTDDFTTDGARYIVENVLEGLDAPGEWYLNRHTGQLFYIPMPGEDMRKAEVIAPVAPMLLRLTGNAVRQQFVEHLRFRNLAFEYSRFELPPGNSNDPQGSSSVTAAVVLQSARDVAFEHCRFARLGTWAVELMSGCAGNRFVGNEIMHVGGGGFRINGGTLRDHPLERTGDNWITDNRLQFYGDEYPSAVGILLMHTCGNVVAHNEIDHGWYTGISIGWVWGYGPSVSRDNRIEFNHIHDIGQGLLSDLGGIYTLGVSPGTVIRNNVIHDVNANQYGGWGIYHDEGSTHILDENNLVYNTKFSTFNIHYAKELTVRNNIFAFGRLEQLSRGRMEPHRTVSFESNIVYWKSGELFSKNWKDAPYYFYYQPRKTPGASSTNMTNTLSTFEINWNLYFNPDKKQAQIPCNGGTWAEWQKRGKDRDSLYADPLFADPEHFDFRLKPGSPAFALGFQPFDPAQAGPRERPEKGSVKLESGHK